MKFNLIEGVRQISKDEFIIDMKNDYINDIIDTVYSNELYIKRIDDNVYTFGYELKPEVSSKMRSYFIYWLKSIETLTPELESFIIRPIKKISSNFNIDFDLFVCPKSERSKLVNHIIKCITNILPHSTNKKFIEVIKNMPSEISFDFESLKADYGIDEHDKQFIDIKNYVDNELMPKIKDLTYFSLAQNVKPKYRKYIQNYLVISSSTMKIIEAINCGSILIVDDINTSGSTLREIIRIITSINKDCNIYIFTLIGR